MNDIQKQKIISTFRKAGKEKISDLFIEAAELTGWLVGDAEKRGFTRPQAIEIAKQHLLNMSDTWKEFAENHLEALCRSIKPRLKLK